MLERYNHIEIKHLFTQIIQNHFNHSIKECFIALLAWEAQAEPGKDLLF